MFTKFEAHFADVFEINEIITNKICITVVFIIFRILSQINFTIFTPFYSKFFKLEQVDPFYKNRN
jgi:hypothetical protein